MKQINSKQLFAFVILWGTGELRQRRLSIQEAAPLAANVAGFCLLYKLKRNGQFFVFTLLVFDK